MNYQEKQLFDKLRIALRNCYDVMTRELKGLSCIQPELKQAKEVLQSTIPDAMPKPALRPWAQLEVPIGTIIRHKTAHQLGMIVGATKEMIVVGNALMTYQDVFERWETEDCRVCGINL